LKRVSLFDTSVGLWVGKKRGLKFVLSKTSVRVNLWTGAVQLKGFDLILTRFRLLTDAVWRESRRRRRINLLKTGVCISSGCR